MNPEPLPSGADAANNLAGLLPPLADGPPALRTSFLTPPQELHSRILSRGTVTGRTLSQLQTPGGVAALGPAATTPLSVSPGASLQLFGLLGPSPSAAAAQKVPTPAQPLRTLLPAFAAAAKPTLSYKLGAGKHVLCGSLGHGSSSGTSEPALFPHQQQAAASQLRGPGWAPAAQPQPQPPPHQQQQQQQAHRGSYTYLTGGTATPADSGAPDDGAQSPYSPKRRRALPGLGSSCLGSAADAPAPPSGDEAQEVDSSPSASPRPKRKRGGGGPRKQAGAKSYDREIDSSLPPDQIRHLRRALQNRESARRVRAGRQSQLDALPGLEADLRRAQSDNLGLQAQLAAAAQRIQALEASERALQATVQLLQQQQQQHAAAAAAAGPPAFGSPADLLSDFGGDLTFAQFLPLSAIDF